MKTQFLIIAWLTLLSGFTILEAEEFPRAELNHFERTIRPILIKHCIKCHGPQRQEGDLRLDSREQLLKGGNRGAAVHLEKANESLILMALRHENDLEMPPGVSLSESVLADFARWISQGAAWPETFDLPIDLDPTQHWAFQPISNPPIPVHTHPNGSGSTVDPFVLTQLAKKGLKPSPRASKHTLARRVYQDLTGLPPTVKQLKEFLEDDTADAYETLIDEAMADPQFGVHWARMWMDIARYADNKGYIFYLNREFKWAYTYRDYLIEAFNDDRSYRQLIVEQLAADKLVKDDLRPLRAMGFITLGDYFVNNKYDMIDDRIDVITRGLMGLTVTCARCHDHKFDPIPTADYYGLYGVLDSSHDPIVPPLFEQPEATPEYIKFREQLAVKQAALETFVGTTISQLKEDGRTRIADYLMAAYNERNNPDSDNFMLLTEKGALNPRMIRRWKNHLKESHKTPASLWHVWNAFAAIPDDSFTNQSGQIYQELLGVRNDLNSIVTEHVLSTQPKSMQQVAEGYEKALLQAKQTVNREGEACDDPDIIQLASSLYGPMAPPDIPVNIGFDFLDLFPDRTTQAEFKKVLEDVENFIRNDAAAPARALVLKDNEIPTEPYVFKRGNPNHRGEYVPRKFLSILDPAGSPFEHGSGRLELAHKIASPDNPLTARVMVNRIWMQLMGQGIVSTPSDFGVRGTKPTHPLLLDHLATEFISSEWSIKSIIKRIVLSQTYQQTADAPATPASDPNNTLYWRAERKRLNWEQTRDAVIHATGELDLVTSGPSFPLDNAWTPRRSAFSYINRLDIPTLLRTFNFPSPNASSGMRSETTVPQQALWFFNNPFIHEAVNRISARAELMEANTEQRITFLYLLLFSRYPEAAEHAAIGSFLSEENSDERIQDLIHVLLMSNEFVHIN